MCPNVGAVVVHKDGNIAQNANLPLCAVRPQRTPLLVEKELNSLLDRQLATVRIQYSRQCIALPSAILRRPVNPAYIAVHSSQHSEQRVVREPGNIVLAEFLKSRPHLIRRAVEKI